MKKRYKIVLAYDGTHYSGYQLQSNGIAVQQKLEEVLEYLNRAPVRVFGSSRTDAGVHAKGFVAHFDLTKPIALAGAEAAFLLFWLILSPPSFWSARRVSCRWKR